MSKYTASTVKKAETTTTAVKPINKKLNEILATDEGLKFLNISEMAGSTTRDLIYEDPIKASEFCAAFHRWDEAGRPNPTMPKMPKPETLAIPQCFTRLISKNKEYLVINNRGGNEEGVTWKTTYAEDTHPITGKALKLNIITGRVPTYFLEFDVDDVKARMERANNLMEASGAYLCQILIGAIYYELTPKNFLRPRKELVDAIAAKKNLHL